MINKKIDDLHNEWQQSTQINKNKTVFKLKKENRLFNRILNYSVSKQISEKNITLFLHTPLILHNIKVNSVTIDKSSINHTLNEGKISAQLDGIGYTQLISAKIIAKRLNFNYKIYVFIQYKFTDIE
ncbi:ATPase RavA [Arsenophonus endosymbiont of Bemisia tabaci Q2]|nr:ATPase RavA [Arsenophonus endosymbiont of Bemisia tabaci Q2]CAA2930649.1 ATPase RavA [Arsenophonus endosymbiont of Bemisia tabaci Q2]